MSHRQVNDELFLNYHTGRRVEFDIVDRKYTDVSKSFDNDNQSKLVNDSTDLARHHKINILYVAKDTTRLVNTNLLKRKLLSMSIFHHVDLLHWQFSVIVVNYYNQSARLDFYHLNSKFVIVFVNMNTHLQFSRYVSFELQKALKRGLACNTIVGRKNLIASVLKLCDISMLHYEGKL